MEWWQIQELMWTATGIVVSLVAVSGLALRFAVKPFLGDLQRLRSGKQGEVRASSNARLDRIEDQMEALGSALERLADAADFDRQLRAGDETQDRSPPE